ncbi:MAG: lysophospholipase [Clostridia bacterium]|nr:lysophospholipase [Clostridia bacterium]
MQRFTTTSYDGHTTLAAYKLVPENPRGMVQISHGMCEYLLRYEGFAKFLAEAGILVFGHDHLGHGYSVKNTNELGYTVKDGGVEALVEDVHNLVLKMKQEYPELPVILFGHSMGSFIARAVVEKYSSTYAGAVFCGTCGDGLPTAFGKAVTKHMITFLGEHYRSKLMQKIVFGGYNKQCGEGCDPNAWLSRDEEVVKAYNDDMLCGFNFTLRGYNDLFTLIEQISREEWASTLSKDLPVMVISGEADPVGAYGAGPQRVAEKLLAADMRDVTLKLYPEMRHEIVNELEHETVWTDLREWMEQKLA